MEKDTNKTLTEILRLDTKDSSELYALFSAFCGTIILPDKAGGLARVNTEVADKAFSTLLLYITDQTEQTQLESIKNANDFEFYYFVYKLLQAVLNKKSAKTS